MSIVSESYSAVKYYKYNEHGKMTTEGLSTFKNSETYTGAVAEGSNVQVAMRMQSHFLLK